MPIVLDGSQGISTPMYAGSITSNPVTPSVNMKNRLINGNMVIDQRNAGASVTPNNSYTLDRWQIENSQTSKLTVQQDAGAVTPPAGFTDYLGITSSSAYSVTSSDYFMLTQSIEGFNTADLGWGTANAKTITISFWVRSSLTGTFGATVNNSAQNRTYPFTYTISSANTWEYKTVTIAGDTTGTWLTTNGVGIRLRFGLGVGSTYSGTAGAWTGTSNIFGVTGATSVVGTNGATFYITGVQLEVGSTATSFDYRPYGTELQLCQRYYYRLTNNATAYVQWATGRAYTTSNGSAVVPFPVAMRAKPTFGYTTPVSGNFDYGLTALGDNGQTGQNTGYAVACTNSAGFTTNGAFAFASSGVTSTVYIDFSAEL